MITEMRLRKYPAVFVLILLCNSQANGEDIGHFHEKVVPILQRRCVGCHSDAESKGEFSVESAKSAFAGEFIIPGDAESSRFIEVITPVDGEAEMPKGKSPMTTEEIAILTKWVEEGAEWPSGASVEEVPIADFDWWSLQPLRRPAVPKVAVENGLLIRTPIDAFVQRKLTENGLSPSSEADRRTLVRRLYFDLIGLPPTPEQVNAFVESEEPNSYEQLVDKLLDSKHYGERWARHWLDVVHYADTHGYDKDKLRPNAWPYRDYVIRSLNEDKPYARFVQEQVAGDVLWPYTMDGITATGFIAAGPWDFIGHAEVPESKIDGRIARYLDRDDMVTSTINTFASTTVQCARCHNHKFDPISQEHYFSLQTVFAALDRTDRSYDSDPKVARKRSELAESKRALDLRVKQLAQQFKQLGGERLQRLDDEIRKLEKSRKDASQAPEFGYHSQFSDKPDVDKWVQVDLGEETLIDRIDLHPAYDDFGGIGAGFGFPVRYRIEVSNDSEFRDSVNVVVDKTQQDLSNPGLQCQSFSLRDPARARFVRITATKLAHRKDAYIFALGDLAVYSNGGNVAKGRNVTALDSIEAPPRWQRKNLVDEVFYSDEASDDLEHRIAKLKVERQELLEERVSEEIRETERFTKEQLRQVNEELKSLPPGGKVYAGTIHHGSGAFKGTGASGGMPRTIHVLHRGDILQPRQLASPGRFPLANDDRWRFELAEHHSEGDRRVALAKWLTDRDNPLTWRSIANRVWQYHFGRGIVDTPNDFGRMGAKPTHPELLDWLATEFRDGGQSLKSLHRLIVTSSVYRQVSDHSESNAAIDSGNQFLWRMHRRRLSAEEVRDAVLLVAGKLNTEMYGPGVRLFELERPEHSPHYEYHKHDPADPKSHRRTVYRFIVRSQPDPFMTTLDCADSSQSVAKRIETVTPLQALSMMNNKFMLAMADYFAERVGEAAVPQTNQQVDRAFALALGRLPTREESRHLWAYTEQHGLKNTCRLLFNLNEFVFVD